MVFYKDSNDLYHVGTDIIPASSCKLRTYEGQTIVALDSPDNFRNMPSIEVTNLQKEDLTYYADLDEFLTANADFLK